MALRFYLDSKWETNQSLLYCGDVTTILTHHKLLDMWNDEKKTYAPIANIFIYSGYMKAKKRNSKGRRVSRTEITFDFSKGIL